MQTQTVTTSEAVATALSRKFDVLSVVAQGDGWRVYVAARPTSQAAVAKRVEACGLVLGAHGNEGSQGERMYVVVE